MNLQMLTDALKVAEVHHEANEKRKADERRREWATGILFTGRIPVEGTNPEETRKNLKDINSAIMIVAGDQGITVAQAVSLFERHPDYRRLLRVGVMKKFLERGAEARDCEFAQKLAKAALESDPDVNLFKERQLEQEIAMGIAVIASYGEQDSKQFFDFLRKKYPFLRPGNRQNLPHVLARALYPQHYDDKGMCQYAFTPRPDYRPKTIEGNTAPPEAKPEGRKYVKRNDNFRNSNGKGDGKLKTSRKGGSNRPEVSAEERAEADSKRINGPEVTLHPDPTDVRPEDAPGILGEKLAAVATK